jgi:hypothetical protein
MHPVYRQVIAAIFALITIMVACNRCHQRQEAQQWTPELEHQLRDMFYTQGKDLTNDENAKNQYADCCVAKVKELFPHGFANLNSQLSDSLKISIMKMGAECSKAFNVWTLDAKQSIKLQFYSYPETKALPDTVQNEYADCLTYKVTTRFPSGLGGDSEAVKTCRQFIDSARKDCLGLIANKYRKAKLKKIKIDTTVVW